MNYGLYTAASGALTQMARQDTFSNNLANVNTVGFKEKVVDIRARQAARQEDGLVYLDSNALLERLGAGVMPTETRVVTSPAALEETGEPLDLALASEGFFVVQAEPEPDGQRLTRDGRMTISGDGRLVRATDGAPVLGVDGGSIDLDPAQEVRVLGDGRIVQGGGTVARLRIGTVDDPSALAPERDNLLRSQTPLAEALVAPDRVEVRQGFVETSGVSPVKTLMGVTGASRAAQGNMRMISMFNELMGRAINTLGRVS